MTVLIGVVCFGGAAAVWYFAIGRKHVFRVGEPPIVKLAPGELARLQAEFRERSAEEKSVKAGKAD